MQLHSCPTVLAQQDDQSSLCLLILSSDVTRTPLYWTGG